MNKKKKKEKNEKNKKNKNKNESEQRKNNKTDKKRQQGQGRRHRHRPRATTTSVDPPACMRSSSLPGAATKSTGCSSIRAVTRNSANRGVRHSTSTDKKQIQRQEAGKRRQETGLGRWGSGRRWDRQNFGLGVLTSNKKKYPCLYSGHVLHVSPTLSNSTHSTCVLYTGTQSACKLVNSVHKCTCHADREQRMTKQHTRWATADTLLVNTLVIK